MNYQPGGRLARRTILATTTATLALCALLPTAALAQGAAAAQDQPAAPQAKTAEDAAAPDITVTGTRVQRDGFQAPTPTTVLGAAQLAISAPSNLADVVNQLPALSTGLSPRVGNLGTSTGQGGLNVLNLRALGPTRTLVLLDGRRIAGSTSTGVVDINTIPQQLVERVDVVTGGASAAYGSDAVTGVVNFILNKRFEGLMLEGQLGITGQGDGATRKLTASLGKSFAGGRGHFLLAGEYSDQDGIFETRSRGWFNSTKLVANPVAGGPRLLADNVNLSTATGGGLIIRDPRNGTLQGIQFGPGGTPQPFNFGTQSGTANLMIGGERNDIAGFIPLAADIRTRNVYGRLSYEIADDVTAYVEGSYGRSEAFNPAVHQFKLGNLTIQRDNAFLPDSIRTQMVAQGLTQLVFGTWNQDIGKLRVINKISTYRGVVGLDAKLGGSFSLSAYYQYGRTNAYNAVENQTITARYNQAIDAIRDPVSGAIVCRNPANGCVPLNIIGTGVASPAAIAAVTGTPERRSKIEQHVAAISVQGEPFSTWAGPVSVAVGGEYRRESTAEVVDALSLTSSYFSGNFKPVNGAYDVKEGFIETVVPLAKDLPFARSLELNGAVRATEYSTSGFVTTWKVGATWRPVDGLLLRAVRSRDIRAPNIADLFANVQVTQTVTDPFNGGRTDTVAAFLSSGNPNLKPEKASNLGLGAVLSPSFLPGFQLSLDYYRIDIQGAITTLASSSQQAVNLCFQGVAAICPLVTRDGAGRITAIRLAGVNAGSLKTSGFDLEASYRGELLGGRITVRGLLNKTQELIVDTGVTRKDYSGEVANQTSPFGALAAYFPDLQGSLSVTYENSGFTGFVRGRYIGKGVIDNTFTAADTADNRVPSVFYMDATLAYAFGAARGKPEIYFAVDNLLDKAPPRVAPLAANPFLNTGTSPGLYDAIGRSFRVGVRAKF